jgi:transporter family-2 protein
MILGIIFACIAGSLVSVQSIFNSKVSEHAGSWVTTALVLGLGFAASLMMGMLFEGGHLFEFQNMKPWYWMSGFIGVGVVTCLVHGIRLLGPTLSTSIVLISQLAFALLWDSLGWLGLEKVPFTFKQLIGVLVIISGIMIFKFGGVKNKKSLADV